MRLSIHTLIEIKGCQDQLRPLALIACWKLAGGIHGPLCSRQECVLPCVIHAGHQTLHSDLLRASQVGTGFPSRTHVHHMFICSKGGEGQLTL